MVIEPNKDIPVLFHGWSNLYGTAARTLQGAWLLCEIGKNRPIPSPSERLQIQLSCVFGMVFLWSFAIELALKSLAYLKTGQYDTGHNVWKLFNGLDIETKTVIRNRDETIEKTLSEHQTDFEDIRYPLTPGSIDPIALERVHNVLMETIDDPQFRQLCRT